MANPDFSEGNKRPSPAFLSTGTAGRIHAWPWYVRSFKRAFDLSFSIMAIPLVLATCILLAILNPFLNPGPLFFRQQRMGLYEQPFTIIKFRTMSNADGRQRNHDEDLEEHRIGRFGHILRKSRVDELPNFLNVLAGNMSVIGPRPDMLHHAIELSEQVPRYKQRFRVKPGISGLAQVRHGYVGDVAGVTRKARLDAIYVEKICLGLEVRIILQTVLVIVTGFRAR